MKLYFITMTEHYGTHLYCYWMATLTTRKIETHSLSAAFGDRDHSIACDKIA